MADSKADLRCESRRESEVIIVRVRLERVHEMHISRVAFIKTAEDGKERILRGSHSIAGSILRMIEL